ncbi:MAG: VWA domain-containing protein [Bacteroidota bacterium]
MKTLLFWLLGSLPILAQTTVIKENLGTAINSAKDQILPVCSPDGQTLYFSENAANGHYQVWSSTRDSAGNWQARQPVTSLNLPTSAGKYVFAQVEPDLLLVNGWFEQVTGRWTQEKGLSWYIPSQKQFMRLDIPALQTQARGRFVNAFLHQPTKTLWLSYAEVERRNLYVCQPDNPSASWLKLRWRAPVRLPSPLNSDFDDTTPFLDADGKTLYFASNRPGGYGADDIYSSRRLDDGWANWSEPKNLGFSVNSNRAEIYYCLSPARDYAYFVSYKHSYGAGDIFRLRTDSTQRVVAGFSPPDPEPLASLPPPPPLAVPTELDLREYKPNNLVFLLDRSASMRAENKLPLLKLALKRLIGELRDVDRLTLISFADSAVIHYSARGVTGKDSLHLLIDGFVAAGTTKANRGLALAYDYTQRDFIENGNNEIMLVTDGQFRLLAEDHQRITANQQIVLSVVGLGDNRKALTNLRQLAGRTQGSFLRIREAKRGTEALLQEVKARSRVH